MAQTSNSLLGSAQLALVYLKKSGFRYPVPPRVFLLAWGNSDYVANMFESILSTVKCLSRENNCNVSPERMIGGEKITKRNCVFCCF